MRSAVGSPALVGSVVMSETLNLQPLQLRGLCSVPCMSLFPQPSPPILEERKKEQECKSHSPRSPHLGRRVGLSGKVHLDFIGWNRIRQDQMFTRNLRQLRAGCGLSGPAPFYTNPYSVPGKSSVDGAALESLRGGCEPSNVSESSQPLHPLPDP